MDKEEAKRKLKKLLRELEKIKGRHTELISVYIPAGANLIDIINQLRQEQSTAENIKSKTTRKNVTGALEKILQHLKLFRQTPTNGLVIFCGNVSPVEGKTEIKLWSIEPPEPLDVKIYWCDQSFVLDPLKEMVSEKEVFGLIVLDAREADIGFLRGKKVYLVKRIESTVPSKSIKGGMSQVRYDRIREQAIQEYLSKVGEIASKIFLEEKELKGIIIGGPGPIKERFVNEDYLDHRLRNKILGVKDTGYTGEYGLEELVKRSEDLLKEASIVEERKLLERFFRELRSNGNVVFGLEKTLKALEIGAAEIILISEDLRLKRYLLKCPLGHEEVIIKEEKPQDVKCRICGNFMEIKNEIDLEDFIVEEAKKFSTKVKFISSDTSEGKEFKNLGGIGAILRFKID